MKQYFRKEKIHDTEYLNRYSSPRSEVSYLEIRGATDTANHEAPVVFDVNLKIVMKNIALLYKWLRK